MIGSQHRRQAAPVAETPAEAAQKHNPVLLHALQTAHPVLFEGKQRFIHTINYQILGGGVNTTVYLTGGQEPIEPHLIQLQEQPK